jgi:asparagine synthase (glutamine-hydrolysing)
MCGIYISNIVFSDKEVKTKLSSINFRGPDYMGVLQENGLTFGHLRLSILDLDERSNQPMSLEDYIIVFNGEIYNFLEIKEELISLGHTFNTTGDTEVLLKAYKEWGQAVVPKLNGMFVFAIHDKINNILFCSRDRLGVKPFYYYWKDGVFEICSQLKPISENKTINKEAVSIYLDCTYIPSPYSIYNDVYKLPPGNNLIIDLNSTTHKVAEYWNLKPVIPSNLSYEEAVEKVHDLFEDAVRIRLKSDVPFGSFLSGGIDSALVTSLASKISKDKIKTFSIGFEDPKFDESKIAATYAGILGTEHKETICKAKDILEMLPHLLEVYDEPFADSSALPSLLLNKITKQDVTVALSGDGGDESFLGYNHFDWVKKFSYLLYIPYFIRSIISMLIPKFIFKNRTEQLKRILKIKNDHEFIEGIFTGYNSITLDRSLNWLSNYKNYKHLSLNNYQKTADLNIKLWLENDSNVKVDRASMAFSVEVRSPFLDYRIIEFARTLPISYRYYPGKKKRILRDVLKKYIPEEVFDQPKSGFSVPLGDWIRNELKEEIEEHLSYNLLKQIPNLNIPKFQKMYRDHLDNKRDYSSYIWRVYIFIKWYNNFKKNKDV